jgi:hypothetical protein
MTTEATSGQTVESTSAGQPSITQTSGNPAPAAEANTGKTTAQIQEAKAKEAEALAAEQRQSQAEKKDGTSQDEPVKKDVPVPEEWVYEGHPAADAALDLMKESGLTQIDVKAIFGVAVKSRNLADVDTKTLVSKLGQTKANLVMAGITQFYNESTAHANGIKTMVHELAGGDKAWAQVAKWAQGREKADTNFAKTLKETRGLIEKGGHAAKLAAQDLIAQYNADPATKGLQNGQLVTKTGATVGQGQNAPMGRQEFLTAMKTEHNKSRPDPRVINALRARRDAGRKAGMQ